MKIFLIARMADTSIDFAPYRNQRNQRNRQQFRDFLWFHCRYEFSASLCVKPHIEGDFTDSVLWEDA